MLKRLKPPSPAMLVAFVALIASVSGSAVATVATTSVLNKKEKKQVKALANKRIAALAYTKQAADARFYTKPETDGRFYTKQEADGRFLSGAQLQTSESKSSTLITPFNVTGFTDVLTHTVTTPRAGRLLVFANLTAEDGNTGNSDVETRVLVDGTQVGVEVQGYVENSVDFYSTSTAPIGSAAVAAGEHEVKLQAYNGGAAIAIEGRSITTLFIPS